MLYLLFNRNTESRPLSLPVLLDSSEGGHEVQAANCKTKIKLFNSFKAKTESLASVLTKGAMAVKAVIRDRGSYDLSTVDIEGETQMTGMKLEILIYNTKYSVFTVIVSNINRDETYN